MARRIGREIKCLSTKIGRKVHSLESIVALDNISGENGFIINYLAENSDRPIYQKDIEHSFGITRSTASITLSLMEQKGLIIRKCCSDDARLKEIVLTEEGKRLSDNIGNDLKCFDDKLESSLSKEEVELFISLIDKLKKRLEEI